MNLRRSLCLFAVVLLLGTGLSMWRYLARLQPAAPAARMPAPAGSLADDISKAVGALPRGTIAVHVPLPSLRVGAEETVRVVVSDRVPVAVAEVVRDRELPGSSTATVAQLAVSEQMNAQLYGDADRVKITPVQSPEAFVAFGPDRTIDWRWIVKPLAPGDAGLILVVTAQLDERLVGAANARVRVAIQDVPVQATTDVPAVIRDAIGQNWSWVWAALVVPAVDTAWAWLRRRRENPAGSAANA